MARKPAPDAEVVDTPLNRRALAEDSAALTAVADHSHQVAELYGEGLPYDRSRIVSEARFFLAQSAESMLEAGKRLILLKENEPHGEFVELLEQRLGLNARSAQKLMQAAAKYLAPAITSKASAPTLLGLGRAKLLELVAEPDEDIAALADGGTLAGMTIDEIDAMSSRELREALRKEREARKKDAGAKDKVIQRKEGKISELEEQLARLNDGLSNPSEQTQVDLVRDAATAAELALRRLVHDAGQVTEAPATEVAATAARQGVEFVAQLFATLIGEAGIAVDFAEMVTPAWVQAGKR